MEVIKSKARKMMMSLTMIFLEWKKRMTVLLSDCCFGSKGNLAEQDAWFGRDLVRLLSF